MPEFSYARGRILDSLRYLTEEMREFQDDYAAKTWEDYLTDRKLRKLIFVECQKMGTLNELLQDASVSGECLGLIRCTP